MAGYTTIEGATAIELRTNGVTARTGRPALARRSGPPGTPGGPFALPLHESTDSSADTPPPSPSQGVIALLGRPMAGPLAGATAGNPPDRPPPRQEGFTETRR